jgi:dGTPase
MDWADDLAYAVHDMEDFYRSGIIPLDRLLDHKSNEAAKFTHDWSGKNKGVTAEEGQDILKYLSNISGDSLQTPYTASEVEQLDLKELSSMLIGRYLGIEGGGLSLQNHNNGRRFLQTESYLTNEVSLLKHMTIYYVIRDSSLAAQQRGQKNYPRSFRDFIYNTTLPDSTSTSENIRIIPDRFQERGHEAQERGERLPRIRFTTDVIASMTEKQATRLHKRLIGDTPGSLQDQILG